MLEERGTRTAWRRLIETTAYSATQNRISCQREAILQNETQKYAAADVARADNSEQKILAGRDMKIISEYAPILQRPGINKILQADAIERVATVRCTI